MEYFICICQIRSFTDANTQQRYSIFDRTRRRLPMLSNEIHALLQSLQRRRGRRYIALLTVLGFGVGYYALPSLHWFHCVIAILSTTVGIQLAVLRQKRHTWRSIQLARILDGAEQVCLGGALATVCLYALTSSIPLDVTAGVIAWSGFFFVLGACCGEYSWQKLHLRRMSSSAQLRYLCISLGLQGSKGIRPRNIAQ